MSRFDYLLGRVSLDSARQHLFAGKVFADKDLFDEAIKHYRKGLKMYGQLLDENDPLIAAACLNYSLVLRDIGNYEEAADVCRKAISIYAENAGREADEQNAYTHLGVTYMSGGKNEQALGAFLKAKELISGDKELASSLFYIGTLYNKMGRFEEAWDTLNQSYNLLFSFPEKDSVFEAGLLLSMGVNRDNIGDYEEALRYYTLARRRQEEYHESPRILAVTEDNIASAYEKIGEWKEAIKSYRRAISIHQEGYAQDHYCLLNWYKKIGYIEFQQGLYSFAKDDYLSARYHAQKLHVNSEFETADLYYAAGICEYNREKIDEAVKYSLKAISLFQKDKIHNQREIALSYELVGNCLARSKGGKEKPEDYYLKAIALYHAMAEDAPASLCLVCGIHLINSKRYPESRKCSEEALRGFLKELDLAGNTDHGTSGNSFFSIVDGIAQCHYNIGFVHYIDVEYVNAVKEFISAYAWYRYCLSLESDNDATAEGIMACEEQLKLIYQLNSQNPELAFSIFEKAGKELEEEYGVDSTESNISKQWIQRYSC